MIKGRAVTVSAPETRRRLSAPCIIAPSAPGAVTAVYSRTSYSDATPRAHFPRTISGIRAVANIVSVEAIRRPYSAPEQGYRDTTGSAIASALPATRRAPSAARPKRAVSAVV